MTTPLERMTIDGIEFATCWIGPGPAAAPTIVMLHHQLGPVRQWGTWAERVAEQTGCGVFWYGRQGDGESAPVMPPPVRLNDEAHRVLPKVLDLIGFERGVLLGHGGGASVATSYAGGVQDHRIRGLVLIAPDFLGVGFQRSDILEAIGYIRVPILIVQGAADRSTNVAQIEAARDEAYCPVEVALIAEAGHSPHLEQPTDTTTAVADFINTLMITLGERTNHGG